MNTQPTPETDAEEIIITKGKPTHWVSQEFARRLERERDELAAMWEREAEEIDGQGDESGAKQIRRAVREILSENSLGDSSKTKTKGYDLPWIDFAR
jgi:hypothetical protein